MEMTMSTISSAPAAVQGTAGHSWASGLGATLKGWWVAYMTWRIRQTAIAGLCSMSELELKDMGLTRCEIAGAVRGKLARDPELSRYS
jgi:uncharacterized protein YjiS (DUF1127 family)